MKFLTMLCTFMSSSISIVQSYTQTFIGYVINLYDQSEISEVSHTIDKLEDVLKINTIEKYSFGDLYNEITLVNYFRSLGDSSNQLSCLYFNTVMKSVCNFKNNMLF